MVLGVHPWRHKLETYRYPNCRQMVSAAYWSTSSSHTVPQLPLWNTSTRPMEKSVPLTRRKSEIRSSYAGVHPCRVTKHKCFTSYNYRNRIGKIYSIYAAEQMYKLHYDMVKITLIIQSFQSWEYDYEWIWQKLGKVWSANCYGLFTFCSGQHIIILNLTWTWFQFVVYFQRSSIQNCKILIPGENGKYLNSWHNFQSKWRS